MLPERCPVSVCNVDVIVAKRLDVSRCRLVWTTEVGLGPGDIVLDGTQLPPWKGHSGPQFSAHVCCRQMLPLLATAELL